MKLEIKEIKELKRFINSLSDSTDNIFINEAPVRRRGSSCMLPIPKSWEGRKVKYLVIN